MDMLAKTYSGGGGGVRKRSSYCGAFWARWEWESLRACCMV